MLKIVVTQNIGLSPDQVTRLQKLGKVTMYKNLAKSPEEWLERCIGADIICTGRYGMRDKIYDLKDVFIAVPFVGVGFIDKEKIRSRNIKVANAPGCNKDAVSEWVIYMVLSLFRGFPKYLNAQVREWGDLPEPGVGLTNKRVTILGRGNIGSRVGRVCESFDMIVKYFTRGDSLLGLVRNADIVIDTLSLNETTKGLLNRQFFKTLKRGSYFVTPTGKEIWDIDAIFEALDSGILAGAALDAGNAQVGDIDDPFYRKLLSHPKILVTPHIAYSTDITNSVGGDIVITNIEAWINGNPTNLYC